MFTIDVITELKRLSTSYVIQHLSEDSIFLFLAHCKAFYATM